VEESQIIEQRSVDQLDMDNRWVRDSLWTEEDYAIAKNYSYEIGKGEKFPPIRISGNTIHDGHHRLYAHKILGIKNIDVVDFQTQIENDWVYQAYRERDKEQNDND